MSLPSHYPYGPPQPYLGGPQGHLVVTLRPPLGLGSAALISPAVSIDGFAAPVHWGHNAFPVPAGHRTVSAESRYLWTYGRQQMVVEVPAGRSVEVHYSGPLVSFGDGAMGLTQQPRPGRLAFGLILGIPLALVVVIFVLSFLSTLS